MMEVVTVMVAISVVTVFFIDAVGLVEKFKRWLYYLKYSKGSPYKPYSLKPIDCSMCMSFWLFVFMGLSLPLYYHEIFVLSCATSLLTILIRKICL